MSDEAVLIVAPVAPRDPVRVVDEKLATLAVLEQQVVMLRDAPAEPVVVRDDTAPMVVQSDAPAAPGVVVAGFAGPRGPQGPAGGAGPTTLPLPVGAVVQGLRVVRAAGGTAYPVDTAVEAHAAQVVGVALQSVTVIGTDVVVQTAGTLSDSSWAWADGVVWCGADGALTQAPASTGWLMQVGRVVSPTVLNIDIEPPIYRG